MKSQPESEIQGSSETVTISEDRAYRVSWIDGFNDWIERLPVRAWIFYVAFGSLLILVQLVLLLLEGGFESQELIPVILFNGIAVPALLAWIRVLDHQAVSAVDSMKPILEATEREIENFKFRLSNMPFIAPLIVGSILTIVVIIMEQLWIVPARYEFLGQLPVLRVVYQIIDKASAFLYGVFFFHTVRQLRLVHSINSNYVRVNLFHLRPLRAFSRLTASTAVGLVIGLYAWMLINPDLLANPVQVGFGAVFTVVAILVFTWPLFGAHRLMEAEKEKTLREIDHRFEAIFSEYNQRFEEKDHLVLENLGGTIASLDVQHRKVEAIATWPWRPETARNVITAIALPLILMVLRFLIERAFGI